MFHWMWIALYIQKYKIGNNDGTATTQIRNNQQTWKPVYEPLDHGGRHKTDHRISDLRVIRPISTKLLQKKEK